MVAQSPKPGAHVLNVGAFRIELEFRSVGFWGEWTTGVPGEKPLGAEKRTNNKLNPYMAPRERERGKPEYPEKNLSEQSREPTTNSTHI